MPTLVVRVVIVAGLLGAGCSDGEQSSGTTSTAAATPSSTAAPDVATSDAESSPRGTAADPTPADDVATATDIIIERDQPYYDRAGGPTQLLDVYRPAAAEVSETVPLVVVFHPNPVFGGAKESVKILAAMIAERGAVVVAPSYGAPVFDPPEVLRWFRDEGACAVWSAVEIGSRLGADVARLTLVGDVTGILPAQMATFDPPAQIDGCLAEPTSADIHRAVLFETDWLFLPDFWDDVFDAEPGYFEAMTHWDDVEPARPTELHILAGEISESSTVRSMEGTTYPESEWVRLRDPRAELGPIFERLGLLADGEMSFADVARVTTEVLAQAGWDVEFTLVPDVGHGLSTTESKEFVAELALAD